MDPSEMDARQLRAHNNIEALPEGEAKHVRWLLAQPGKEFLHHVSAMQPGTGMKSNPRQVKMLEVLYDHERANGDRDTYLKRIKNALTKHSDHKKRFGEDTSF